MATKVLLPFNSSTDIGIFSVEADRIRPILAFSEFPSIALVLSPKHSGPRNGLGPSDTPIFPQGHKHAGDLRARLAATIEFRPS
jgi:hypothetical protein